MQHRSSPLPGVEQTFAWDRANSGFVIYLPFGNLVLGMEPMQVKHLVMVIAISALPTFVLSGIKEIFNLHWL